MINFPKNPGPYRMYTESGNTYLAIVEINKYKGSDISLHVFQPRTFRSETCLSNSREDIMRMFSPTSFEPLFLYDADDRAEDIQRHDVEQTPA